MAQITIQQFVVGLGRFRNAGLRNAAVEGLTVAAKYAERLAITEAKKRASKKSGTHLWQTIRATAPHLVIGGAGGGSRYGFELEAGNRNVRYARIQELGGKTRPHTIRPRHALALHFFWKKRGRFVFFKVVHHPGSNIPARPYLRPALEAGRRVAKEEVLKAMFRHWQREVYRG